MGRNLACDLEDRAAAHPDRTALIFQDDRRWTYRQLDAAASRVARALLAAADPGSRIGLHLANSPELVVGLLGAWKAGLVPVPMSGLYGPSELVDCVGRTDPAAVVMAGSTSSADAVRGLRRPVVPATVLRDALADPGTDHLRSAQPTDDQVGLILFTGGSTGEPKAVAITHDGSYRSMATLARGQKSGSGAADGGYPIADPAVPPNLVLLPLFHGGGIQSLLFSWHVGRAVLLVGRFDVPGLGRLVPRYAVDNLFLLPTMVFDLVRAADPPDLSSVRKVLVAGQRLDPGLQAEFEGRYGVIVVSNYGSAELGHVAGWNSRDVRDGRWKPGSVGRVYDGVQIEIRDPDGREVPIGELGEIWIRTHRTTGYLGGDAPDDGEDLVRDGWVRSGDVGRLDDERVLFLAGRVRELIKTGGFQVWPAELEQVLRRHPGVTDVAVVGRPDERLGEVPVAFVVPSADPPTATEIVQWCRDRVAHFKAIREVRFVSGLPRSEAGKVQRGLLLDRPDGDRDPAAGPTGRRPAAAQMEVRS